MRSIVDQVDRAFLGNLPSPAPSGLEGFTPAQELTTDLQNLDVLSEAVSVAETGGANVTAFVLDPTTALALATLKQSDGSNQTLLGNNPREILGREVFVSRHVSPGTIWALDARRIVTCPASSSWQDFLGFECRGGGVGQAQVHLLGPVP